MSHYTQDLMGQRMFRYTHLTTRQRLRYTQVARQRHVHYTQDLMARQRHVPLMSRQRHVPLHTISWLMFHYTPHGSTTSCSITHRTSWLDNVMFHYTQDLMARQRHVPLHTGSHVSTTSCSITHRTSRRDNVMFRYTQDLMARQLMFRYTRSHGSTTPCSIHRILCLNNVMSPLHIGHHGQRHVPLHIISWLDTSCPHS